MPVTDDNTAEIILEHLREIRRVQGKQSDDITDLKQTLARTRQDVNSVHGDVLRLEIKIEDVDERMQRIEKRLNLVEA